MRKYIPNNEHWFLVEAHLAALYRTERLNLIDTWNTLCRDEMKIQKIERFILSTFPDSSTNWFMQKVFIWNVVDMEWLSVNAFQ